MDREDGLRGWIEKSSLKMKKRFLLFFALNETDAVSTRDYLVVGSEDA